uniref:Uncharacterized protein n=1 Tax=Aegilops tauschii subsp. strangulata TaxID=200361 RepID=A0A453Q1P0_AEGTS
DRAPVPGRESPAFRGVRLLPAPARARRRIGWEITGAGRDKIFSPRQSGAGRQEKPLCAHIRAPIPVSFSAPELFRLRNRHDELQWLRG